MLIFGIMGGSFIELENMPASVQTLSKITPNAWALDGFTTLGFGGTLASLSTPITALLLMGIVLFLISAVLFGKKNLVKRIWCKNDNFMSLRGALLFFATKQSSHSWRLLRNVRSQRHGGDIMKKIFAIAWKDAIIRFASSSELLFFIILQRLHIF